MYRDCQTTKNETQVQAQSGDLTEGRPLLRHCNAGPSSPTHPGNMVEGWEQRANVTS